MKIKHLLSLLMLLAATVPVTTKGQSKTTKDSTSENKEVKNRNVLLNASADNQPRQIDIGVPTNGITVYEDGLPVSYSLWPCVPYYYWAASSSYKSIGLTSISEDVITNGIVNYSVDSHTREGGKNFEGHVNYTSNIFDLQKFDVSLAGPIKNGWSYSLGAYLDMDPGTNKLADSKLATDMQIFKAGLTKIWNNGRGKMSLFYKYANDVGVGDSYGPFIYKGDGSVKEFNGFRLGYDCFLPGNSYITYRDIMTGNMKTTQRTKGTSNIGNDLVFNFDYNFNNNTHLNIRSKYRYAHSYSMILALAGIGVANETSGYTYAYDNGNHKAGDIFTGNFNSRYLLRYIGWERNWMTTAELIGKSNNMHHNWRIGYNFWCERQRLKASTGVYAHTVEADPVWLYHNGSQGFALNTGGEYYDTHEIKTALYASDDWQATDRLWLSAGARLEYYNIGGSNAMAYLNATDQKATYDENIRNIDYSVKNGKITTFDKKWIDPTATFNGRYTIANGFGLLGEYVYAMQRPNSQDFAGAYMPILKTINIHLGQLGLFWNTHWMKLASQVFVISQSNYKSRTQFTNPNDASDIITIPITNGVQTTGWATDAVFTPFKGFTFHGLFTIQNPQYKDFNITANFSDGSSKSYNFNNKITTGVSKTIIELDPSYMFDKFRVWASFRYQGKQYINKTNTLYFNGRWETFGGVDYNMNKMLSLSVNLVNILNQKGADGSIGAADLVEDVSAYKNYLMAGTYIRPFTVEFAAHINF